VGKYHVDDKISSNAMVRKIIKCIEISTAKYKDSGNAFISVAENGLSAF
jgi:hypothetical protein